MGLKNILRIILATGQFTRNNLCVELKKIFKINPNEFPFIDVLPQHKIWFESIQKN